MPGFNRVGSSALPDRSRVCPGKCSRPLQASILGCRFPVSTVRKRPSCGVITVQRAEVALLGAMAGLALLLSAVGICVGRQYGGTTKTRNRAAHRSGIDNPPGDETRCGARNPVFSHRNCSRLIALPWSAACHAHGTLRRERLRCSQHGWRCGCSHGGHHAGGSDSDFTHRWNRSRNHAAR